MARRNNMAPVLMQGDLQQSLGSDGMAEALRLRWVQPNLETGHLQITNNQNDVNAMRKLATESQIEPPVADAAHGIAMNHAGRHRTGQVISEIASPATGNAAPGFSPNPPSPPPGKPTPPPSAPAEKSGGMGVGDNVMVAEDGKTYQGRVQSMKQDGKFVVSFGAQKPMRPRDYDKSELRMIGAADTKPA